MSTVSQDNYVMEIQVQQEEWAKQKDMYREEKSGLRGKGQNNINIHSFGGKRLLYTGLSKVWKTRTAVKNKTRAVSSEQPHQ